MATTDEKLQEIKTAQQVYVAKQKINRLNAELDQAKTELDNLKLTNNKQDELNQYWSDINAIKG